MKRSAVYRRRNDFIFFSAEKKNPKKFFGFKSELIHGENVYIVRTFEKQPSRKSHEKTAKNSTRLKEMLVRVFCVA